MPAELAAMQTSSMTSSVAYRDGGVCLVGITVAVDVGEVTVRGGLPLARDGRVLRWQRRIWRREEKNRELGG